ncbi:MAG: hypothetical protein QOE45_2256 [Frankiaceae bacterium]|jgi:poly(3-hydroxybutyrate) depolymerase|nr:hypothetical protein [Frankiaceae bacterium]
MSPVRRVRRCLATVTVAGAVLVLLPATANAASSIRLGSGRTYRLAVEQHGPVGYSSPTVIVLHGMWNSWTTVQQQSGFDQLGAAMRWSVVYGETPNSSWNAGICCSRAVKNKADDVGYLVDVVRNIRARGHHGSIYLAGFSNGGMLALRAACERPLVFNRVVSVAGTLVAPCPTGLHHARHIHGVQDPVVPYNGGWSKLCQVTFPPVRAEAAATQPNLDYALVPVAKAGHTWPAGATAYIRDFFLGRKPSGPVG